MVTANSVRYVNEIRSLNLLFRRGPMTRAQIARELGLNRSTIGNIVADLLANGLVVLPTADVETSKNGKMGRPGALLQLNPLGSLFIGAEVGVEHLSVLGVNLKGEQIAGAFIDYPTSDSQPEATITKLASMITAVLEEQATRGTVYGIGVAIPAIIVDDLVENAPLIGWKNTPFKSLLAGKFDFEIPIEIENEANAFALAHTYSRKEPQKGTAAFLLIENGTGGGIVIDGRVYRGSRGFAGGFGQLPVGDKGFFVGRGKPGHLESYIGKDALLSRFRDLSFNQTATFEQLLLALVEYEPDAVRASTEWGDWLAKGLLHIVNAIDPGTIILGGSVAQVFPFVRDRVERTMKQQLIDGFPMPNIEVSPLGRDGAALGGALHMHQRMFSVDENALLTTLANVTAAPA